MPVHSSTPILKAFEVQKQLQALADPSKVKILSGFFKTAPGQYGEGDIFIGVTVPLTRSVARKFRQLPMEETLILLKSPIHEERLLAIFILVEQFHKSEETGRKEIFTAYLNHCRYVNNWDLVDSSARQIVGGFLKGKNKSLLIKLASSSSVWERRIAVIATYAFIIDGDFEETFKIAAILLKDEHDLIHKAVGWMLREAGNRDIKAEEKFLIKHYKKMPRTMLRYAIERFPQARRAMYLQGFV